MVMAVILIATLAVLGFIIYSAAYKSTERTVETTVLGKERICTSTGTGTDTRVSCYYAIYTDDGTFKLTDSFVYGRFRSSDIYGQLRDGQRYRFKVAGFRLPLVSEYPNIVSDPEEIPS
jgi:hypothetical protein